MENLESIMVKNKFLKKLVRTRNTIVFKFIVCLYLARKFKG